MSSQRAVSFSNPHVHVSYLADPRWLVVKSAIATSLAVTFAHAIHVPDALSCAFVALVCVSPSVYAGLRRGGQQLGAAALASAVTAGVLLVVPRTQPLSVGLALGLTVATCHLLGWAGSYAVAGFTSLYVALLPFRSLTEALTVRTEAVLVGAVSATVVNVVVAMFASRSIRERRERIVRTLVARALDQTAVAATDPARRIHLRDAWRPVFAALEELRVDLADQAREVLLPRRAVVRDAAARSLQALDALAAITHLGRHLALVLEHHIQPEGLLGEALHALAIWLRGDTMAPITMLEEAQRGMDHPALAEPLGLLLHEVREIATRQDEARADAR